MIKHHKETESEMEHLVVGENTLATFQEFQEIAMDVKSAVIFSRKKYEIGIAMVMREKDESVKNKDVINEKTKEDLMALVSLIPC